MWVELLIGWNKFLLRHDQSEALPRSRKWHVISMDSEFFQSFLRRYFAGKPVVARFVKLIGFIEFVPSKRLWINVVFTQLVQLQYSTKLYGQCTLQNKILSQIFSWFCMYTASFDNRTIARWRRLTITTRIHFLFALLFEIFNSAEDKRTIALICTRKEQTQGYW